MASATELVQRLRDQCRGMRTHPALYEGLLTATPSCSALHSTQSLAQGMIVTEWMILRTAHTCKGCKDDSQGRGRGLPCSTCDAWRLGFCDDSGSSLSSLGGCKQELSR